MNDTPRTDEFWKGSPIYITRTDSEWKDFASQLERELNGAREQLDRDNETAAGYITERDQLRAEVERLRLRSDATGLVSLAITAKELCEFTRHNQYPEKMTNEFVQLTQLVDNLDTAVRRVFK